MSNPYCEALSIDVPDLAAVKDHREANIYALLLVTLVERGEAMTLVEVAERFEAAGVAPADQALRSLKRCKPGRPPVYRDGDDYALDPFSDELDLWLFRLGLRSASVPHLTIVRSGPEPRRAPDQPLTIGELDEAWREASLYCWSAQRLALAVLDAHGQSMSSEDVIAFISARTQWHLLQPEAGQFGRRGAAVRVLDDGRWAVAPDHPFLISARNAVRDLLDKVRDRNSRQRDPVVTQAYAQFAENRAAARAAEAAARHRVLVHAFPTAAPAAVTIADVGGRAIQTFHEDNLDTARERIAQYDVIGAIDVRPVVRTLDVDTSGKRLDELGPPQKTKRLNRYGRTLTITTPMLIRGSCGITRPLGDEAKLHAYLSKNQITRFVRRLEADIKSLVAYYEYGRLHGMVRLRWRFLDERIPAPWCERHATRLYQLKQQAFESGQQLEVVAGSAPGWSTPWSRSVICQVLPGREPYTLWIVDETGLILDDLEVQLARVVTCAR